MIEQWDSSTPPQDTGPPDSVERDGAALSSAEDLDEDRLREDPLEAGMDPPEGWTVVDKYGVTPFEQAHPRPLSDRLAEEQPDVQPEPTTAFEAVELTSRTNELLDEPNGSEETDVDPAADLDAEVWAEAVGRGQVADGDNRMG
ncbi:MAG: hypothetical protein ACRDRU_20875 [Pseudonocardiaceae bacterium]